MNENHRQLCPSPEWAAYLHGDVLPWLASHVDLGGEMLEIGPGPGASTEWLRHRVKRLVALEVDEDAVESLAGRFVGTNVEVVIGDATATAFPGCSFDAVGAFTMLHHVPTLALQQAIVAEVGRVLRPGGAFIGSDSLASYGLHEFHEGDDYNPIDPAVLLVMLRSLGFEEIVLRVGESLLFTAHKAFPTPSTDREREEPR